MLRLNERTLFSLILVGFAVLLLVEASGLRVRAALLPRIIGYPLLVGSVILLLGDLFPAIEHRFKRLLFSGVNAMDGSSEESDSLRGLYSMMLWMLGTLGLIYFTGVIAGLWLGLFVYCKWMIRRSWLLSVLYPTGMALFIYGVFVLAMDVYYFTRPVHQWL